MEEIKDKIRFPNPMEMLIVWLRANDVKSFSIELHKSDVVQSLCSGKPTTTFYREHKNA